MNTHNILVLTYWSIDSALISTYTLPYIRIIQSKLPPRSRVCLLTISARNEKNKARHAEIIAGLGEENIYVFDIPYRRFGAAMLVRLSFLLPRLLALCIRYRIKTIHAWCTPAGALGYLLAVPARRDLVLDSFEPHAETMIESGTWRTDGFAHRMLFMLEKKQLQRAREVICAAPGMVAHSQQTYGITKERYFIKPACVDLSRFDPAKFAAPGIDPVVCVYAGKFGDIYLKEEVFDFFSVAYKELRGNFRVLLLTSHSDEEIVRYCESAGFPVSSVDKYTVPSADMPEWLSRANFAICPVRPVSSKQFCSPIKNGEYWAMGLPVVITSGISVDSELIAATNSGYVLKSLDRDEYLRAVRKMLELINEPHIGARIRRLAVVHRNFTIAEKIYETIYGGK